MNEILQDYSHFRLNIKNEILHYLKFNNLSKNEEKYDLHREELNFEHIWDSVHTT